MAGQHTPGPWRVDEGDRWTVRCPSAGFEDNRAADGKVCEVGYRPNAYLIAAAPDLLAALKEARFRFYGTGPAVGPLESQIDAAIAKATAQ